MLYFIFLEYPNIIFIIPVYLQETYYSHGIKNS